MEKRIVIEYRNISKEDLFGMWKPSFEPEIYEYDDPLNFILTLSENHINEIDALEEMAVKNNLKHRVSYQATLFDEQDCADAPLLAIYLKTHEQLREEHEEFRADDEGIELTGPDPIEAGEECKECGYRKPCINPAGLLKFKSTHDLLWPVVQTEEGIMLFRQYLLDEIRKSGFTKGMKTVPASVKFKKKEFAEYSWIYSDTMLGYPAGNVSYQPCPVCGFKIVEHWRTFITHMSRAEWNDSDFAINETGSLYISQRVYQLLKKISDATDFSRFVFEPYALD